MSGFPLLLHEKPLRWAIAIVACLLPSAWVFWLWCDYVDNILHGRERRPVSDFLQRAVACIDRWKEFVGKECFTTQPSAPPSPVSSNSNSSQLSPTALLPESALPIVQSTPTPGSSKIQAGFHLLPLYAVCYFVHFIVESC